MDEPKSVLKQTGYECGLFNFGKAATNGIRYFNPAIVRLPDGLWLVTRRCDPNYPAHFGLNSLMAFKLNDQLVPQFGKNLQIPSSSVDEHFEDPRVMTYGQKLFVACCNFIVFDNGQKYTGSHQIICEMGQDWRVLRKFSPTYGKNGGLTTTSIGHEKNWTWFIHNGQPHLLYHLDNMTVVRFGWEFKPRVQFGEGVGDFRWQWGELRAGSSPVRVGNEYWTFFHSSLPWQNLRRRYFMGAAAFEAEPPFRLTRISEKPILSGSMHDQSANGGPPCVFPSGAILESGIWTVTLGVNDTSSAWIKIPHADISEKRVQIVRARQNIPEVGKQVELAPVDISKLFPNGYNPTIIAHDGAIFMAYRYHPDSDSPITKLAVARINDKFEVETNWEIPIKGHSIEDPKFFRIGSGALWMSWVESYVPVQMQCSVRYGWFDARDYLINGSLIGEASRPIYGENDGLHLEKNWVFFSHKDATYFIYKSHPEQVLVQWNGSLVKQWNTYGPKWKWGQAKGGTAPINVDGSMIRFFHSTIDNESRRVRRRYYIGACLMDSKPPFRVLKTSSLPIVIGTDEDGMSVDDHKKLKHWKANVVFCSGAMVHGDKILISLGINDCRCAIAKLSISDLHL